MKKKEDRLEKQMAEVSLLGSTRQLSWFCHPAWCHVRFAISRCFGNDSKSYTLRFGTCSQMSCHRTWYRRRSQCLNATALPVLAAWLCTAIPDSAVFVLQVQAENRRLVEPLHRAKEEVDELRRQLQNYDKDKQSLAVSTPHTYMYKQ